MLFEYHICNMPLFIGLFQDLLLWKTVEGTGDLQDAGQDLDSKYFPISGTYVCSFSFLRENKEWNKMFSSCWGGLEWLFVQCPDNFQSCKL